MTQRSISAGIVYSAATNEAERRITAGFVYVARVGSYVLPPNAPSDLGGTVTGYTTIDVWWVDNSDDETGFEIQYSTASGFSSGVLTVTLPAGTTSHTLTGLTHNRTYYIRVRSMRNASRSLFTPTISRTTWNGTPATPTNLQATSITSEFLTLAWTDNATNETNYKFQITLSGGAWTFLPISGYPSGLPADTTSWAIPMSTILSVANPGDTRAFRVVAGNTYASSSSTHIWVTLPDEEEPPPPLDPPIAPTNLQVTSVDFMAISLAWTDASSDEDGFWIDRSQDGETFATIATVGAGVTAYTDPWLMPDTLYFYQVRAYKGELLSGPSNTAQAQTLGVDPPTDLTVEALSATSVYLTWQDNTDIEQAYLVERSLDNGQTWQQIAQAPASQTYFTDAALAPETWYCYRVRALYPLVYLRSGLYSGRGLDLWDGTYHLPPPQGWETLGFDESDWTPRLYLVGRTVPPPVAPDCDAVRAYTGTSIIAHRGNLLRSPFILPAGPILSARLRMNVEDYLTSCYINGQALTLPPQTLTPGNSYNRLDMALDPSLFQPGPNVLAIHFNNETGNAHGVSYLLEIY